MINRLPTSGTMKKAVGEEPYLGVDDLHVGHGGGDGAEAEAGLADGHDGGVEVFAHEAEGDEGSETGHEYHLCQQNDDHRERQVN